MTACLPSADNLRKISESWEILTTSFGDPAHSEKENILQNETLLSALHNLSSFDLDRAFIDWYLNNIQEYLKREIVDPFRNKSRSIMTSHHQQLVLYERSRSKSKSRKKSLSPIVSMNQENMTGNNDDDGLSSKVELMSFDNFNEAIWAQFLKDVGRIVDEVHSEISNIKTNIWQIAHLLTVMESGRMEKEMVSLRSSTRQHNARCTKPASDLLAELNQRCDLLIETIFLMDGSDDFESIFRVLFEYAFIHYSNQFGPFQAAYCDQDSFIHIRNPLVDEFGAICFKLHRLQWLKVLEPVFINVGYGHIELELHRNYRSRKSPHFVDYSLFEEPKLLSFTTWVHKILINWFRLITTHSNQSAVNYKEEEEDDGDGDGDEDDDDDDADDVEMAGSPEDESCFITPSKHNNKRNFIDLFNRNKSQRDSDCVGNKKNRDILSVDELKTKIEYFCYEKFGEMRTMEMFDIICDFPDSEPALEDLKQCLTMTSQWRPLQISMLSQFKNRILHHGASSTDIISQYIATIGALKVLDPTGITLEIVGEPMRLFLRERDDAIRCVVSLLMEEKDNGRGVSLLREFQIRMRSKARFIDSSIDENHIDMEWNEAEQKKNGDSGNGDDDGNESEDSIASDREDPKQWEPAPLDSMFARSSIFKRTADTIGLLVKIFGSREIFVEEYRKLLGDRLLSRTKRFFNVDLETEYLELMKLRFGEQSMQDCHVMVQDIVDSQRVNTTITDLQPDTERFSVTIVSSQYWPQTNGDSMTNHGADTAAASLPFAVPESVQSLYDKYQSTYAEIKKPRHILWLPDRGSVDLQLELCQQTVKIKTTPFNASVLMMIQQHFEDVEEEIKGKEEKQDDDDGDNGVIGKDSLCALIGMDYDDIVPALMFWIRRGVVKRVHHPEEEVGYRLADGEEEEEFALQSLKKKTNQNMENQEIGAQNMDPTQRAQLEDAFEKQVLALLNFNALPIHKLHNLLRQMDVHPLFASLTMSELQKVLDKLINQKRLVFNDGMYKRAPK